MNGKSTYIPSRSKMARGSSPRPVLALSSCVPLQPVRKDDVKGNKVTTYHTAVYKDAITRWKSSGLLVLKFSRDVTNVL